MKLCKTCNQERRFDPAQVKAKASGFMGNVCWGCFVIAQRARSQGLNPKDPEDLARSAQLNATKLAHAKVRQQQREQAQYVIQANLYVRQVLKDAENSRNTRLWVNTATIKQISPQYQELVAELQNALITFNELTLQFPFDITSPGRQYLEQLLKQAQTKCTKQGAIGFDYKVKAPRGKAKSGDD